MGFVVAGITFFAIGAAAQFAVCLLLKKRALKLLPLLAVALLTALVAVLDFGGGSDGGFIDLTGLLTLVALICCTGPVCAGLLAGWLIERLTRKKGTK